MSDKQTNLWKKYNGKGFSAEHADYAEKATADEYGEDIHSRIVKVDDIETGAQVNVIESVKVDGTALSVDANKAVDIPLASATKSGNETVYVTGVVSGQDKQKWDNWVSGEFPIIPKPNIVVIGGRAYPTVQIGNQLWLAENLDYKFEVSGSPIPIGSSGTSTTPAAWYYNNDEASYGINGIYKCGLLYNWYAAKYLDDNKATLLPDGWHVPSPTEISILATEIGGASTGGAKLKALNNSVTSNWPSRWGGTDEYGFNALPSGNYNGYFNGNGTQFYSWTTSDPSTNFATQMSLSYSVNTLNVGDLYKTCADSIRLVKNLA